MTLLFKLTGALLIFTTCTALGFIKANNLKLRAEKLFALAKGVTRLKELINLQGGEIDRLISQSFDNFPFDYGFLEASDREITESLFEEIGLLDSKSACNRCEVCLSLLNSRQAQAEQKYHDNGKLYKSIGMLFGIFICIFII